MAWTTLDGLRGAIADWLHRDDLSLGLLTDLVNAAELRLRRVVRLSDMITSTQVTIGPDYRTAVPSDYLDFYSCVAGGPRVRALALVDLREVLVHRGKTGDPRWIARSGATFELAPDFPISDWTITLSYYAAPPLLSDSIQENLWTRVASDALFWGALAGARGYIEDEARLQLYEQYFRQAVEELKGQAYEGSQGGAIMLNMTGLGE